MITALLPISTPEILAMTDLAPTAKGVLVGTMVGATLLLLDGATPFLGPDVFRRGCLCARSAFVRH